MGCSHETGAALRKGTGPVPLHGDGVMFCWEQKCCGKEFHSRKFCVKLFWLAELGRGVLDMWKYLCCFPEVKNFNGSRGRLLHGHICVPASLPGNQPIHLFIVILSILVNPFCMVLILSITSLLGESTFQMLILFYLTTCLSWPKV